jgi:hypothetical protein
MRALLISLITFGLIFLPANGLLEAMPIPSAPADPPEQAQPASGGYYHYYGDDPVWVFIETALYVALCVGALIVLDNNLENVTIIVQD